MDFAIDQKLDGIDFGSEGAVFSETVPVATIKESLFDPCLGFFNGFKTIVGVDVISFGIECLDGDFFVHIVVRCCELRRATERNIPARSGLYRKIFRKMIFPDFTFGEGT